MCAKWVVKQQRQLRTSTTHLAQELLINVQCSGGFKKFYKGDKSLEDEEHSGQPLEVDNDQLRASLVILIQLHEEFLKKSTWTIPQSFSI